MKRLFILLLTLGTFALPLTTGAISLSLNYPEIPTPTGPIDLNCLEINTCELSIALLLVFFYGASIWVGGILAFLALTYAGILYILSGASAGMRSKARRRFSDTLWGLAILLLANVIIFTINPTIIQVSEPLISALDGPKNSGFKFIGFKTGGSGGDTKIVNKFPNPGPYPPPGGGALPGCASNYVTTTFISCSYKGIIYSLPDAQLAPVTNDDPLCNRTVAQSMLADFGWDNNAEWICLEQLWQNESGWNVDARNKTSCAYGIPQSLPPDRMAEYGSDWKYNPITQITWGMTYILNRPDYGSPCNAWNLWQSRDPHWY